MDPVTSRSATDQAASDRSKESVQDSMAAEKSFSKKAWTKTRVGPPGGLWTPAVRRDTPVILRSSKNTPSRACSAGRIAGLNASRYEPISPARSHFCIRSIRTAGASTVGDEDPACPEAGPGSRKGRRRIQKTAFLTAVLIMISSMPCVHRLLTKPDLCQVRAAAAPSDRAADAEHPGQG